MDPNQEVDEFLLGFTPERKRMAKKKGNVMLWLFLSMTLGGIAGRMYMGYLDTLEEEPVAAPSASAPVASAVPSSTPGYEWPTVRWLDQVAGEWVNDEGSKLVVGAKRVKKVKDWSMVFSGLPKDGGGVDTMTCDVSPELKDGGFNATCTGYGQEADTPVFFRFHMNLERKLYVESPSFGGTFKAKGTQ